MNQEWVELDFYPNCCYISISINRTLKGELAVSEKPKILTIGAGTSRSDIEILLAGLYTGKSPMNIAIFLSPREGYDRNQTPVEEIVAVKATAMIPIINVIKDSNYYPPAPTKLKRRKKANEKRNFHNKKFKTQIKSLKR